MVDPHLRRRNSHLPEQVQCARPCLGASDWHMHLDRLGQLVANGQHRMQRGQRILENRADPLATKLSRGLCGQIVDALAVEPDLASGNAARRVEQSDDRRAGE